MRLSRLAPQGAATRTGSRSGSARADSIDAITSRAEALVALEEWFAALWAQPWPGRRGATIRSVAGSLTALGRARGGIVFAASVAEIALGAGVQYRTARNAIEDLRDVGWLVVVSSPGTMTATRWRLRVPRQFINTGREGAETRVDLGADWSRWGAVGKSAAVVWCECSGATSVEIADRIGVVPQTVRKHLRRLRALGAVRRDDGGRYHRCDTDGLAELYGTAGRQDRDRRRLERRREHRRAVYAAKIETAPARSDASRDRAGVALEQSGELGGEIVEQVSDMTARCDEHGAG
jgi:DNA-binding transcriptional ArsR family regulator